MKILTIKDIDIQNKTLFIRSDLNVPIHSGKILSDFRIKSALPTIQFALKKNANIILASHLGRPKEGLYEEKYSLYPIAKLLQKLLNFPVFLKKDLSKKENFDQKGIFLLENVRFNKGEKNNEILLSKKYASLCDIFVMDAFGVAHRKQSSNYGISKFVPISCGGILLEKEILNIQKALLNPKKPIVSILGGAKLSTKFSIIKNLLKISNNIIVGGGIANTFIAAKNCSIGNSLYEPSYIEKAKKFFNTKKIYYPIDVKVLNSSKKSQIFNKKIYEIENKEKILDIGNQSIKIFKKLILQAKTIIWNGPMGVCEIQGFSEGTKKIIQYIIDSGAFSLLGGGDTIATLKTLNFSLENFSYVSTGGGSFLKFIEGKKIPCIEILKK
ncbi:phosphoglycerate kinase [bacterium endosymbiont of Pedicinus badii]|uniref:phosphoglycerate kinase n=1 Tax=bacterium endosymbiont of Pedicinus badii TaxID=1719126 RepID=UPI0009BAACCB|nr:phosphoglycerate kinase [bacterium endosymbiont of Pedicinus badii]OQM34015.1 phosphoglycerate kinase [bacterium endosymbiont of Pedicinus badii]